MRKPHLSNFAGLGDEANNPYGLETMISKRLRACLGVVCLSAVLPLPTHAARSQKACFEERGVTVAVVPFESVNVEEALERDDGNDIPWFRPNRKYRCIFLFETPTIPGNVFKICNYDCLGYGAGATFVWPADLPCPGSFNDLFPPIPDGYPDPNRVR